MGMWSVSTFLPQALIQIYLFKPHKFITWLASLEHLILLGGCGWPVWGCYEAGSGNLLSFPSPAAENKPKETLAIQRRCGRGHSFFWFHHRRAGYRETAEGCWGRPAEWRRGLRWWVHISGAEGGWLAVSGMDLQDGLSGIPPPSYRENNICKPEAGPGFALPFGVPALVVSAATAPACPFNTWGHSWTKTPSLLSTCHSWDRVGLL